jgi:hypothetical protein
MFSAGPSNAASDDKISTAVSMTNGKLVTARRSTGPKTMTVRIANLKRHQTALQAGRDSQGALRFGNDHQSHSQNREYGETQSNIAVSFKSLHLDPF